MIELNAARLRELLHYDSDTGVFTWRESRSGVKKKRAGLPAGSVNTLGYIKIKVEGRDYAAHRLAWLYVYGEWPQGVIDHLDGNRARNPISNLRDVPVLINRQNQRTPFPKSKTGLLGVWAPTRCCPHFVAAIKHAGKTVKLGKFATAEQAHEAYVRAKRRIHEGCTL